MKTSKTESRQSPLLPAAGDGGAKGKEGPALLETARGRYANLLVLVRRGRRRLDVETVHDLRVASRRLTEAARVLEGALPPGAAGFGQQLKRLRAAAGGVRDLDVLGEHVRQWKVPVALQSFLAELQQSLPVERQSAALVLRGVLRSTELAAAVSGFGAAIEKPLTDERWPVRALEMRIDKRRGQLAKAFGNAAMKQSPRALHEARIAAKKLRYAMELDEAKHQDAVKFLKAVQELLGDHHDVDAMVETLHARVEKGGDATAGAAWKRWRAATEGQQAVRAARFLKLSYLWMNGDVG